MQVDQPKRGRPSAYTEEIAKEILRLISCGETLRAICRQEDMPAEATVRGWYVENREGFSAQYAHAREAQAEAWLDKLIELSESATPETVNVIKNQCDQLKWTMSRNNPRFAEKIRQEFSGVNGGPMEFAIHKLPIRDKVAALRAAAARPSG